LLLCRFAASIYATPTVADLDGDDRLEIIVGTSAGMLYVIDGQSGFVRRFFPMQFHSIQAQVAVADLVGGPQLEIIVGDMGGTVAVVNAEGEILWDQHLSGSILFAPTVADMNEDGQMDVVVATVDEMKRSQLYVLRGDSGEILEGFPVSLPRHATISGPILIANLDIDSEYDFIASSSSSSSTSVKTGPVGASVLLEMDHPFPVHMAKSPKKNGTTPRTVLSSLPTVRTIRSPHLIIPTFDGRVYVLQYRQSVTKPLDSKGVSTDSTSSSPTSSFCLQKLDATGGKLHGSVLLDDVTNDGYLDLIVGSLNGEVAVYETSVPYHSSNAWSTFPRDHGRSFTYGDMMIVVNNEEKQRLKRLEYNSGENLVIPFVIKDRSVPASSFMNSKDGKETREAGEAQDVYKVYVIKGSNRKEIAWQGEFTKPGTYHADIILKGPEKVVYGFILESRFGKYSEDFVSITVSTRFYVWLKYLVIYPILILASVTYLKVSQYI
jgi:hypothetical protein